MNKGHLNNEERTPIYWFRMELRVKLSIFTLALTNHFYSNSLEFDLKLTKKAAEKILKTQLYLYGINGSMKDGELESSFENGEVYNAIYESATNWVKNKYPHLIEQTK